MDAEAAGYKLVAGKEVADRLHSVHGFCLAPDLDGAATDVTPLWRVSSSSSSEGAARARSIRAFSVVRELD